MFALGTGIRFVTRWLVHRGSPHQFLPAVTTRKAYAGNRFRVIEDNCKCYNSRDHDGVNYSETAQLATVISATVISCEIHCSTCSYLL